MTTQYTVGDVVRFRPIDREYTVEIVGELDPDEYGNRYVVAVHAFDDELSLVYRGE